MKMDHDFYSDFPVVTPFSLANTGIIGYNSPEPRAQSPEPRAQSPEPRA
jgi:hypothetical protein